ncbi:MAG: ribonuclease III [Deltaproteobacteria bacterium]|nr:ribonuclease III [Deltaproteobacteria bacterium]
MNKERIGRLNDLESLLDYRFEDLQLLDTALTHRSYSNEIRDPELSDNERLEFLGDSVIALGISDILIAKFPMLKEGDLSKLRASVVNEYSLALVAATFLLGNYLFLGKGEEASSGRTKASILADAFEAVIGALFLDGGYERVFPLIKNIFEPLLARGIAESDHRDYKSILKEFCQKEYKNIPHYEHTGKQGPDHDTLFEVRISIGEKMAATGSGRNKKMAEQDAARKALEKLIDKAENKS